MWRDWNQTVKILCSLWQDTLYVHCHQQELRKPSSNFMFHSRRLSYDKSTAASTVSSPQCELLPCPSVCSMFSFPYCYPVAVYVLFILLLSLMQFRLPFPTQHVLQGSVLTTCDKCLCIVIVPIGTLRLPWLRFFRAFSSVVRKMSE